MSKDRYIRSYKDKGLDAAKQLAIASCFSLEDLYILLIENCGETEELTENLQAWREFYGKKD